MGIGIIFIGMGFMSSALDSLITIPWISKVLLLLGKSTSLGILTGAVLAALVQSSSAVTSLVIAMGISQVITLDGAVGIILGQILAHVSPVLLLLCAYLPLPGKHLGHKSLSIFQVFYSSCRSYLSLRTLSRGYQPPYHDRLLMHTRSSI